MPDRGPDLRDAHGQIGRLIDPPVQFNIGWLNPRMYVFGPRCLVHVLWASNALPDQVAADVTVVLFGENNATSSARPDKARLEYAAPR